MTAIPKIKPVDWVKAAILGLLLASVYYSSYTWLVEKDWARDDYNYGYLIPLVALYLIWDKREDFLKQPTTPSWAGMIPFIIGLAFFWLGELAGEFFTIYVSSWLVLVGICWMLVGWKKIKTLAFAFFILLTMFPIPNFLYNKVSVQLKLISSWLGVAIIQAYGMSSYREGNVIDLGFTQLQVVDACSGLRFLIPLIVLSILLAYFFKAHLWKRIVLILSSIPLSIITNSLRIAFTGILYEIWGKEAAEGFFHGFSGWFIFMASLAILLLEMWILKKLPPRELRTDRKKTSPKDSEAPMGETDVLGAVQADREEPEPIPDSAPDQGWRNLFKPAQFIVAATLLAVMIIIGQSVDFREKTPIIQSLDGFPLELGEWIGKRQTMEKKFLDTLDLDDYVIIDYRNAEGKQINFYTAYYETQSKGESIHSPATCLPGSGWLFNEAGARILSFDGRVMPVNRAFMQKGDFKQLSYYWFLQRGRVLTNAYQLKLFVFWDALTQQRTDGALVRVITPVYDNEKLEQAEERLQKFIAVLVPVLEKFIPGPVRVTN